MNEEQIDFNDINYDPGTWIGLMYLVHYLHAVNVGSKYLQTDDMQIDVVIAQLKNLVSLFEKYRETGFNDAMIEAKEITEAL